MAESKLRIIVETQDRQLGQLQGKLKKTDRAVEELNGANKKLERSFRGVGNASKGAANGIRSTGRAAKSATAGVNGLNVAFAKIAVVIGTVTAAVGAFNASVARTESERRIQILASAYGEAAQLADIAARASDRFGNSQTETNNALATTYARLRPVGVGLADIESIYGGFNTAARLAGANAQESAGAFRQLAQALGSGALRGDEFNSIAEQAPLVLQAVADETGIAVGALRDFAAEGGITADIVIKALKRIETEGADQLAESLKGPQQAIKNFQNAFEDLSAEFGKLSEPALISFFNGLTAVTKTVTANMDKLAQVAQTLIDVIYKPFAALAAGIAETGPKMDDFGQTVLQVIGMSMKIFQDFANFMAPVFNVIGKVLGQAITWFFEFAKGVAGAISGAARAVVAGVRIMADAIATLINTTPIGALSKVFGFDLGEFAVGPLNALAGGIENVGSAVTGYVNDVVQAGKDFAVSAEKVASPIDRNYAPSTLAVPTGEGGKGGGGGSDKAGKEAAKALDDQIKQLQAAKDLLFTAEETNKVLQGRTELETAYLEANEKMNAIQREYGQLVAEALSNEEIAILKKAEGVELTNAQLELDKQIADLKEGAISSITEENALLQARLNGTEEEYVLRKKIADLVKAGGGTVSEAEATALVNQNAALKKQSEAAEELKGKYESLAESISGELTGALKSVIDGSKSAEEALSDAFQGIADAFLDMAMKMIQEWLKMQVLGILGGALGGGGGLGGANGLSTGMGGMFNLSGGQFGAFADGGRPEPNKPSIVGERGPELFIPDSAGTVIPNEAFDEARGAMGGAATPSEAFADNTSSIATTNSYMREREYETNNQTTVGGAGSMVIETQVINNVEYATLEQVRIASAASEKKARAQVFSDMKNKPSRRAMVGLR